MDKITRFLLTGIVMCCFVLSGDLVQAQEKGAFGLREFDMRQPPGSDFNPFEENKLPGGTSSTTPPNISTSDEEAGNATEMTASEENISEAEAPSKEEPKAETSEEAASPSEEELISVNFENVDIRDVIQVLSDKAQINMVLGPEISANVNIQLKNVTWRKALDVILSTYGLAAKEEEGLMRIMTLEQFQAEEEKLPLQTRIIPLNFARASDIKSNFSNMLSSRGRIDVNGRTNSLIIVDIAEKIDAIEEIAKKLDTRTPQVLIEALIADVVIDEDDQLGIEWTVTWPDTALNPERTLQQSLGGVPSSGAIFNFGTTMLTNKDLNATIAAWQQQRRVNVLAHPKIITLDNLTATISLTEEIPYQKQTDSTEGGSVVSTAFKSSGINLSVTPQITKKDNYVFLGINVSQSFQSGTTSGGEPIVDSRDAQTNLLVKNKQTAVIGGLRRKNDSYTVNKIPLFGDIPMLGSLFRKRIGAVTDTDLMIFVTPIIVEDKKLTAKEKDRLELFEEAPSDWATQFDLTRIKKKKREKATKRNEQFSGQAKPISGPHESIYLRPPDLNKDRP